MGDRSVALKQYEDIIRFETRRAGAIPGMDPDDVRQELRVVAAHCLDRIEGNTGRTYVRTSVRNAIKNLKRAATAQARMPTDARGKTQPVASFDDPKFSWVPDLRLTDPERRAMILDQARAVDELLTPSERDLLARAFDGEVRRGSERKLAKARARACRILATMMRVDQRRLALARVMCPVHQTLLTPISHRVRTDGTSADGRNQKETTNMAKKIPQAPKDQLPECHAEGEDPVGYETNLDEAQDCQDCPDKASCLTKAISSGLIEAEVSIDPEVAAVVDGTLDHKELMERIKRRQRLRDSGGVIPEDLLFSNPLGVEEEEEPEDEIEEDEVEEEVDETEAEADEENGDDEMSEEEEAPPPPKKTRAKKSTKAKAKPKAKAKAPAKKPATKTKPAAKPAAKPKAPPPTEPKVTVSKTGIVKVDGTRIGKVERVEEVWGWWADDGDESPDWLDSKDAAIEGLVAAKSPKKAKVAKKPKKSKNTPKIDISNHSIGDYLDDGRMVLGGGRLAPAPKEISKEKMLTTLDRVRLGLPFDVAIGMKLIQEKRDGTTVEVLLTTKGYKYDGNTYSSLSGACMHASGRACSGNDFFNFEKHDNIVIKGKGVPGGSYRRGDAE